MIARRPETDLLVIGGGPVGLAVAIAARLRALQVLLLDRATPPIDKACGEGILPEGVRVLRELGVEIPPSDAAPFVGVRFLDDRIEAAGRFTAGAGLGVRRTVLHEALARRAAEVGVDLQWGRSFTGFGSGGVETDRGPARARWIAAVDGARSRARVVLGLDAPPRRTRIGIRRHYEIAPWSDSVEVHWTEGCEIYVTPVGPRAVGVAVLTEDRSLKLDAALLRFPALRDRLAGARAITADLGCATSFRPARVVVKGNVALAGDAAGSVDAITGEGIALGFQQAIALASALASADLPRYESDYHRILRVPNRMTRLLLAAHDRPGLRRVALARLAASPRLFSYLLDLHARGHDPRPGQPIHAAAPSSALPAGRAFPEP
jgi:flavin-dependent dehydrogenase